MTAFLYYLADPRTPRAPRYIGSTKCPEMRAAGHATGSHRGNPAFAEWKACLRAQGIAPLLVVITEIEDRTDAFRAEWRLVARWRRRGLPLLNRPTERAQAINQRRWSEELRIAYAARWGTA